MPDEPVAPIGARVVVGVDVGGTFTDLVAVHGATATTWKLPSTPEDPSRAVIEGIGQLCERLGITAADVAVVLHGTTVATNAILQRRGARTALLTTRGFRDVMEIARQSRPRLYDLDPHRPQPLVPRERRYEVSERLGPTGAVLEPLDVAAVEELAKKLRLEGRIESLAICFLHSYASAAHEEQAAAILRLLWPELPVSLSSSIIPEYREYERTTTTAANAFVAPIMARYLERLTDSLDSIALPGERLRVMQSNGGLTTSARAGSVPATTLLSGVAAGALGGVRVARAEGRTLVLTLDMGGTSCDLALGLSGSVDVTRSYEIGGVPIRLPALDVHTIGAGGGSIAYLDDGGALRVGPRSAGADPGPACYGRGGSEATVTDAHLLLGRLSASGLAAGKIPLDVARARAAIEPLADRLGLSIEECAEGIVRVVNAGMARQMRILTVERGVDPRGCCLVAFGGCGPLHACELAAEVGIAEVLVPSAPGITSALGLLLADRRVDCVQTVLAVVPEADKAALELTARRLAGVIARLEQRARDEALDAAAASSSCQAEVRYGRQGHELRIPLALPFTAESLSQLRSDFDRRHEERFGFAAPDQSVVVVTVMLSLVGLADQGVPAITAGTSAPGRQRRVYFRGWVETPIIQRADVAETAAGPMIIEQDDTTIVVPPGAVLSKGQHGSLLIDLGAAGKEGDRR